MELYDAVDKFVIVEASKSHTGKDKPYNFELNRDRYTQFIDKIVYVKMDDLPSYNHALAFTNVDWVPENRQRIVLLDAVKPHAQSGDKIIVSDVDEIWDPRRLGEALTKSANGPVVFAQAMFYYYVNTRWPHNWNGSVMATYGQFDSTQYLRDHRGNFPRIEDAGFHFSYMGGVDMVHAKMQNIAEANLMVDRMGTKQKIQQKLALLRDPLDRGFLQVDTSYTPTKLKEFLSIYPHFEYKGAR